MANAVLTNTQNYANFFRRRVLSSTQHWRTYVAAETTDTAALDSGRNQIVRAILFALELEQAWPAARELIETLSPYMERRGEWGAWNPVLSRAIEVARRSQDRAGMVSLSALLARLLQRQSRFKQAIIYYRQVIRIARQIGDHFNEARACSNLGFFYSEQGHWWRAETLGGHALTMFEQLDSNHGRAHTENHLGTLYTRQHRWKAAGQHLERACDLWQAMGDDHGLMRGFINLSLLYNEMEQPDKALSYLEKALQRARLTGEEAEIGLIYMNIGDSHRLKGDPALAEAYAWRAEAIFRRFSNSVGLAWVWSNLGIACLEQKKWQEARLHLEVALKSCRNLNSQYGEIKTLTYMVEYELARGNRTSAAARLNELERLISQYRGGGPNCHLQSLLRKYAVTWPDRGKSRDLPL